MSVTFNHALSTAVGDPDATEAQEQKLNVTVVSTSMDSTVAALKKAGALAESLGARITLVVPQIVPFSLELTSPPVLVEFQERRFREIAAQSPVEVRVNFYLCRDALETLKAVLKPHSLVVLGGPRRFWPTREKALARTLRKAGHEVIFIETE